MKYQNLIALLLICFFAIACKSYQNKKENLNLYVSEFKVRYFKTLLRKAFNNSESYKKATNLDRSSFTEPLLTNESYEVIEKYTTEDNKLMVKDSIESYGRKAEGSEGKQVFYFALEKYQSKWLDSIAKSQAKKYYLNK